MTGLLLALVVSGSMTADTTFAVGDATRLSIQAMRGDVEIRTWNQDRIEITTTAPSGALNIRSSGRTIRIDPRHTFLNQAVDLRVTVPADLAIDVEGMFASVDIAGVDGAVAVQTVHGSVHVDGASGRVRLGSVQGGVTSENTSGDLRLHSTNGTVRVTNHEGSVTVEAVNGAVILERVRSAAVEVTSVNGEIRYRGSIVDDGDYAFRNHNGGITLNVPAGTNATVSVSTFSGEIESEFPVTLRETGAGAREFQFTIGNGGARMILESFAGMIRIRRIND